MHNTNKMPFDMVAEFHKVFGHPVHTQPNTETLNDPALRELRVRLIADELVEFAKALNVALRIDFHPSYDEGDLELCVGVTAMEDHGSSDQVEAADALADLDYVVNGAALVFGFHLPSMTAEVHRSNMSKLGADGLPVKRADGKILKGPGYFKPNVAAVLAHFAGPAGAVSNTPPELTAEMQAIKDSGHDPATIARLAQAAQPTATPQASSHDTYGADVHDGSAND